VDRPWAFGAGGHLSSQSPFRPALPGYRRSLYLAETMGEIQVHRHWTYTPRNEGVIKKSLGHLSYLPSAILFSQPHLRPYDVAIASSPTFFAALAGFGEESGAAFLSSWRSGSLAGDLRRFGGHQEPPGHRVAGKNWRWDCNRNAAHIVTVTPCVSPQPDFPGRPGGKSFGDPERG